MRRIPYSVGRAVFAGLLVSAVLAPAACAASFNVLYAFKGGSDGANPQGGVTADASGNLYGSTQSGGGAQACTNNQGCGTVFKIAPNRTETVLYASQSWYDTVGTNAQLLLDNQGNLYGTTYFGGNAFRGSAYKLGPNGALTLLHSFAGGYDGQYPYAGLIMPNNKTTLYGATPVCCEYAVPTVFSLTSGGSENVLYYFCSKKNCRDGDAPIGTLIADKAGNLYGTTLVGGKNGRGVVFKLTPSKVESVLWNFGGANDGVEPYAGLVVDTSGNFYGTTLSGGTSNAGTVYELPPSHKEKVLYSFTGGADGGSPYFGSLIIDSAGNLYGATSAGGANNLGAVFKVTPSGTETVLHSFAGVPDGQSPYGGLVAVNGVLYGTTASGGTYGFGTVFSVSEAN
jgi:uncharacterized repeat protein (TIGR03803 family)